MTSLDSKISKLSHKCFRAILKKFRRKKKRQLLAKEREEQELIEQKKRESLPNYRAEEEEKRRNRELWEQFEERESIRKNKLWMLREEKAQMEFKRKKNLLELEKVRQEEERKRILAEFEDKQILENVALEAGRKAKLQKEEALQAALSGLPEDGDGPWHNPIVPPNFYEVKEQNICHFFSKTGCCRFGDSCSRGHVYPSVSCTLLIRGMYSHFSIGQRGRDEFDLDIALEYEEKERYQDFINFYNDVLPEFKKFGQVVQFKVCQNHEPHLRGNVYIQFSHEDEALEAYKNFNGRFYGGKQLTCDFTHVNKWTSAICGLFRRNECPKGIYCNFLHVFQNPGNEFWETDSDYPAYKESFLPSGRSQRENYSRSNKHRQVNATYHYRGPSARNYHYTDNNDGEDRFNTRNSSDRSSGSSRRRTYNGHHHRSRNSRSRSRSPLSSHSSDGSEKRSTHKKKKKHKKKSKKSKKSKRKHSSESEEKE